METEELIRKYHGEQLKGEALPESLGAQFELLACIHVTETHVSFLLLKKDTSEKYLLKRGEAGQIGSLGVEQEQLERIGGLSGQCDLKLTYWVEDGKEYLLRKYIEGQNLEEYLERHPDLEVTEILDIAIQICRILKELHRMQPPIIHRDIKPQNLIRDRYGRIHLIDFETSRNFDENKQRDTRFYGTDATAAPEQYGYAQTDARTDIYAFGKVLCYLLTGDYQLETCAQRSRRLYAIAAKCCAFDPKKRYQTAADVEKVLLKEQRRNGFGGKKKLRDVLGHAVELFFVFAIGIFMGRYLILQQAETLVQDAVQEQLARQGLKETGQDAQNLGVKTGNEQAYEYNENKENIQADIVDTEEGSVNRVGKDSGTGSARAGGRVAETGEDLLLLAAAESLNQETVTEEDFKNIFRIAVIGTTVYGMTENFEWDEIVHHDEDYINNRDHGTITDIGMLAKMENLSEVYLYNQDITDIEALAGLPIRKLYLSNNRIEDFRVIEQLPNLTELCITKNPIRYLPDFSKCPGLTKLIMNENTFTDLECLKNSSVEQMPVRKLNVINGDYTFLEEMPELTKLLVWNPGTEIAEQIACLTSLKHLELFCYRRADLEFLASMQGIEMLTLHLDYTQDLSPLEKLPNLHELNISNGVMVDISVIRNIKNLQLLNIEQVNVVDLSPILNCKKLKEIYVNEEQAAYLTEHDPKHGYRINIT